MTNTDLDLIELLNKKKERQSTLDIREKEIDDIDLELFSSNIKKYLGIVGNRFKGFVLLLISIFIILVSLVLLFSPKTFYDYCSIIDSPEHIADDKMEKYDELIELTNTDKLKLSKEIQEDIETRHNTNIRLSVVFFFTISAFLLFKRKHLKSLRERNRLVLEINQLGQEIIADYKILIKEERTEVKELEEIIKKNSR